MIVAVSSSRTLEWIGAYFFIGIGLAAFFDRGNRKWPSGLRYLATFAPILCGIFLIADEADLFGATFLIALGITFGPGFDFARKQYSQGPLNTSDRSRLKAFTLSKLFGFGLAGVSLLIWRFAPTCTYCDDLLGIGILIAVAGPQITSLIIKPSWAYFFGAATITSLLILFFAELFQVWFFLLIAFFAIMSLVTGTQKLFAQSDHRR
jgi:hypothetical protein